MQAVILAAGRSTRTYPLTVTTPKPILPIIDRSIIKRNLDSLIATGRIDEIIIVVGFMKEKVMEHVGMAHDGVPVRYVEQTEINGSGGALLSARHLLDGRFMVCCGDDIYSQKDLAKMMDEDFCVLSKEVDDVRDWGIFTAEGGKVTGFREKPATSASRLGNVGAYLLDTSIFSHVLKKTERGELELTDYIIALLKAGKTISLKMVSDYWLPVGYPWKYLEANVFFVRMIRGQTIEGEIEDHVSIKGDVFIGKGSVIRSGTVIEGPVYIGPDCVVGPGAYIRPDSVLMEGVKTRAEIYDAVLMPGVTAKHACYLAHSVIGPDANIGAGTITADYRHDGKNNVTVVCEKKTDTGRRKLGAFLGEGVHTGIGTLIYPGRKIWPHGSTIPGEIVMKDKEG